MRQLITEKSWCGCQDVVISLDDVTASSVRNVMDLIYSGVGGVAGDRSKDFTQVIDMLQIDTIVVSDVEMEETSTFGGFHDLVNKRYFETKVGNCKNADQEREVTTSQSLHLWCSLLYVYWS